MVTSSTFFNGIVHLKDEVFGTLLFNDFSSSASWLSKTSSFLKFHDDGASGPRFPQSRIVCMSTCRQINKMLLFACDILDDPVATLIRSFTSRAEINPPGRFPVSARYAVCYYSLLRWVH